MFYGDLNMPLKIVQKFHKIFRKIDWKIQDTPEHFFSYEFYEIFQNMFFSERLRSTISLKS